MPSSSPSNARNARAAVAARLRELRLDAGLTGAGLAELCGWHKSKSSRIENAKTPPSDADIRAWCRACGDDEQVNDLIAASRNAESLYLEWKRRMRAGLHHIQDSYSPLYEQTRVVRFYSPDVIPGPIQTRDYATAMLSNVAEFWELGNDASEAVKSRLRHAEFLHHGEHHFVMLLEEAALRYRIGDSAAMSGQLGHLLSVMPLPNVSLGIIPFSAERTMWPIEPACIFDDWLVQVELTTAELTIEAPTEVETYLKAFSRLQKLAVYGAPARALITSAIDALA